MREYDAELVLSADAELGEGPVWDDREGKMWWLDLLGGELHCYDPRCEVDECLKVAPTVGAVVLSQNGSMVVASEHSYYLLRPDAAGLELLAEAEAPNEATRMNDGKCDVAGRFWAGTMAIDERSEIGGLFVLDTNGSVRQVLDGVIVSNGLCWSADNKLMYYIDSGRNRVDAFEFDARSGLLGQRSTVFEIPEADGKPDGMTIDEEGFLWVALWDGWQVRRYSPSGQLDAMVRLPVSCPTSCALGGEAMRDLYITTAKPDHFAERRKQPLAGGLFRVQVETPGLPAWRSCVHARTRTSSAT
jgi:sugar lactone lactonase YvrE